MDLYKAIRSLYEEKKRLDRLIESLERLQASGKAPQVARPPARRGRRKMTLEERKQVSERMRKYWAAHRQKVPAEEVAAAPEPADPSKPKPAPAAVRAS